MTDAAFVALAVARWIHYASVMLLFGASLFPFYAPAAMPPGLAPTRRVLRLAALVALVSGLAWAGASLVNITGEADSLFDSEALAAFFLNTGFGKIWMLRIGGLLALLIAAFTIGTGLRERNFGAALIALLAAFLLVTQAWIGHPAASIGSERSFVVAGYGLHVLGAGAWLGGLLPLWLVLRVRDADGARHHAVEFALRRFSAVGILAIFLILAGGLINAWARWSSFEGLIASAWGKVLLAKILGFACLIALAIANRFVLMPLLGSERPARARLMRNVVAEQVGGLAILAAAAVLGILPPPA